MKLYGTYLSPYTRRVAVSLNVLGIPYELVPVLTSKEPEKVRPFSPLTRVPALILDDGTVLVESAAILDEIDRTVGPQRSLMPATGVTRRNAMQATAIGVGTMEKAQWAYYEGRYHPAEKIHEPWIEHNDNQVVGGLEYLDALARKVGSKGWLAGTPTMTQADITAAVACTFVKTVRPALELEHIAPALAALTTRCEALEAFALAGPVRP